MPPTQTDDGVHSERPPVSDQAQVALLATKVKRLSASPAEISDARTTGAIDIPRSQPASWLRHGFWWTCHLAAWVATLSLCVIAALRLLNHDASFLLIWLNAFTRYVYLPAYGCLAWAVRQRRWLLASMSAAVVVFHIALMAPDFVRDRRFDMPSTAQAAGAPRNSPSVRIFFANVAATNTHHDALLEEIAAAKPDVIVLVEYSWPWYVKFTESPVLAPYVYGTGHRRPHIGAVNVFSRIPLKHEVLDRVNGRPVRSIDIELGGRTLRIIGLHGPRPIDGPRYDYPEFWRQMVPLLTAKRGPLVIVGDFNATEHSLVYAQLTADWLRSAHDDRGRGYATTWPNGEYLLPPIRIDHVLLSPEVECERIVEGQGLGSDHKPIVVDVHVRTTNAR